MRAIAVVLAAGCCLASSSADGAEKVEFGFGAGLAYCPTVERNLSRVWPECEGFVAWHRGERNVLRVGGHWLRLKRYFDVFQSSPEESPFALGATIAGGSCVHSEAVDLVDLRVTSVWLGQTAAWLQTHAGAALGLVVVMFEDEPSQMGFLFAPILGASFRLGGRPLYIETGAEIIVAAKDEARFGAIPLRMVVPF